jgi:hypothetical protein
MLPPGFGRRQHQHVDTGIAQASKFADIAGRDRIVKLAGPAPFYRRLAPRKVLLIRFQKKVPPAACRRQLKVYGTDMQARLMLVGLGER